MRMAFVPEPPSVSPGKAMTARERGEAPSRSKGYASYLGYAFAVATGRFSRPHRVFFSLAERL